ncbi:T7-like tail fiber [uncultured Mediterranean phage uvMED]|nr:T7-like tail fiber [uncultured Mediterranean phage uvMED]BAR21613.1 T7-like tail fiber [uncultured Mediterranean phage uvMED]BAR21638.1 T7-like tail fiber [uncultured Mediterranean phage uvMED]BAR21715.1 T7-like tail fiber [uncultured Mediterranean phage uvMED]BAR21727.1 T7-like tail fiber [uncultured Mediterranean phage uvMED]
MANTIKLKRGSGSDPGASDLVVGEVAVRTDTGKLFTKKDDNSIAEISGGIDDGDKGDITVSSSGSVFTIDNDAVTYAKIQNVSATNRILGRDSSGAGAIEEITPANLRTMLNVEDGATADQTKSDIDGLGIAASTAATLATARNIGGVSFNGSANINLPGVNTGGNQDTSGTAAIATTVTVADESSDTSCNILFATAATGNLAPKSGTNLTFNSSSGVLTATGFAGALTGNVTGNASGSSGSCTGNAATATALASARTIAGVSFDGTSNISLNNNAITNGAGYITATLTNEEVEDIVGGMLTGNTETGITVTYQDGDGTIDFVVGTLNQDTTGSAATLTTARTIAGVSFDGSANISLNNNAITNGAGYITTVADTTIAPSTIDMEDNEKILLGTGDDLEIFHSGSHSIIKDGGTGNLRIQTNNLRIENAAGTENQLLATENGAIELYYDNAKKAETVSGGFTVTGVCTATSFAGDGSSLTGISAGATGGGSDEIFYENGQTVTTDYTITNGKNAMSAGPITIDSGVTVTVGSGETLTIV